MKEPERWALVDRLLQSCLSLSPADREVFLRSHCNSDDELYREVESLLDAHHKAPHFLENTAIEAEARAMATSAARINVGARIGPYRIVSRLGTGGMGDVYRAHDTLLDRDVAIKVLTGYFADDRGRHARQEAKAASALNHPNILTIHEIGECEGTPFIVSEYVEGRTLRTCIRDGAMPLPTALDVALQITSALSVAHKAGIVHGDIKPENVMIRTDGLVKVLDFGLARSPDTVGNNSSRRARAGTPHTCRLSRCQIKMSMPERISSASASCCYEMISSCPCRRATDLSALRTSSSLQKILDEDARRGS